jgi:hypothetical protein
MICAASPETTDADVARTPGPRTGRVVSADGAVY